MPHKRNIDFSSLLSSVNSSRDSNNGTQSLNLTELPANILEAFIPGYSLISRYALDVFGFDISIVVSIGLIIFAFVTSVQYLWDKAYTGFSTFCMSSVYIDDSDDLFNSVLEWIAAQRMSKISRSVKAVTYRGSAWEEANEDDHDGGEVLDEAGIFNFSKWAARVPPRYEPYYGRHRFWFQGKMFIFDRSRRAASSSQYQYGRPSDEELIELTCVGRSTKPIRDLLDYVKIWSLDKEKALTVIRRPVNKERSRYGGVWSRVSSRPSRPMETVVLEPEQKARVLTDINEYLHPSSPRWYANRGIPYRRGYLFHGPPGTGKTSLSFALAGIFGLEIYVISLLEPTLTEADLSNLFNSLPRRCIVLLEDIDTAGLVRDEKSDESSSGSKAEKSKSNTKDGDNENSEDGKEERFTLHDLAKAMKSSNRRERTSDDVRQGISLSGLLNAIDGVATHEGRVLVMTTNHPEKLDDALIRPGRVDMQVQFGLATRVQTRELFVRMYSSDKDKIPERKTTLSSPTPLRHTTSNLPNGTSKPSVSASSTSATLLDNITSPSDLQAIADRFAESLPEETFSPAEIQGFLLTRKKEPQRALREVEVWRDGLLEAKERRRKVFGVQ